MFLSFVIETDRHCVILISIGNIFFLLTLVANLTFASFENERHNHRKKTVRDSRGVKSIETVAESYILTFSEITIKKKRISSEKN